MSTDATSDINFMQLAIEAARKSQGDSSNPRVGAVAIMNGQLVGTSFRGEVQEGEHAEYTLLERHLKDTCLAGATIYTSLEPCTTRNPPKLDCAERLIRRKVAKVVVGMLDPNPLVSGLGCRKLRQANVIVELFPPDLMAELEELNREFVHFIENDAIHLATREIADLAFRSRIPRQREAVGASIRDCVASLRRINAGEICIPEREPGYFNRLLEAIHQSSETEKVKAYIRLTAFDPEELYHASWFDRVYEAFEALVRADRLIIEYIFLVRALPPMDTVKEFLSMFERFADRIAVVGQQDSRLTSDLLHPSIVLLERQRIAFTHDRGDDSVLVEATEWIKPEQYKELEAKYKRVEIMSHSYFRKEVSPNRGVKRTLSVIPQVLINSSKSPDP